MTITKTSFGKADGKNVDLYTLSNGNDLVAKVATYGATLVGLEAPDRDGKLADVVLGFDDLNGYLTRSSYFGSTVGRVANRIRNATFELEGRRFGLAANNGAHHLHGGVRGWDKVVWSAEAMDTADGPALRLVYNSRDGEEGYPGNVVATCLYTLTWKNELRIAMRATADAVTLVNMAHHSYWNLGGHDAGPITAHELTLHAGAYTPGDPLVPTGEVAAVAGTPFDFTAPKSIGRDLAAAGGDPVGYDHNFVVDGEARALRPVARLVDPNTGRVLTIEADQPGVQFYSGNYLDGSVRGKGGKHYAQHSGLCLETQAFPNAINVPAWRDQVILPPGKPYQQLMVHRFTTQ
ncbi:MAG TPA: aldose epimerase family protein [Polyangia bacterium]|nr:aldose epimerase family protein [Polyangia bacterium]